MKDLNTTIATLVEWVQEVAAPAERLLVPVSGGSDGAFALWVCARAYPGRVRAIHYGTRLREQEWFESVAPLEIRPMPEAEVEAEALRWAMTQSECLASKAWPVGPRNRTEEVLGVYSRPSNLATLLPIIGVWKSDVMRLSQHVGIPAAILASSRRPDAACGRTEEYAGIGLERIDAFLKVRAGELPREALLSLGADEQKYLQALCDLNEFKRTLPHRGPLA